MNPKVALMNREYDIVIYGASGFTARYVIGHLLEENIRLGLSGRSSGAIRKNISDIKGSESVPIIECLPERAKEVTGKTVLLLNCAGPYIFSGDEIVKACVDTATHYLDITGETFFIESVLKRYDEEARRKGIYIINCCGFDSIPADMGVEYLKKSLGGDTRITSVMRLNNAYLNRTTYESLISGLKNANEMRRLRGKSMKKKKDQSVKKYFYNERTRSYNVIFMGTDPSVVRKTQQRMQEKKMCAADYRAYLDVGSYFSLTLFKIYFLLTMFLSKFELGRRLLLRYPSLFTHGRVRSERPSEEFLRRSSFEILFFGKSLLSGEEKKMAIRGPDPGYYTTSICLSQASLCLLGILERGDSRPFEGGVLTPGCVFHGSDLVDRLKKKGICFEMLSD